MDAVSHLLRRRAKRGVFAASPHFAVVDSIPDQNETRAIQAAALRKRLTPAEIEAMQASARSSAIRAASEAAAKTATTATTTATQRVATPIAQPATSTHTAWVFSDKFGNTVTSTTTGAVAATSSAVRAVSSSSSTSSARATSSTITSSSAAKSSSSSSTAPTSTVTRATSTATVRTITQSPSNVLPSSSAPSASSDANLAGSNSTKDTGLSGGTIAGIVVGALVGLVIIGSFVGWLYRKYTNRTYTEKAPWAKIDDDDITPFPPNEKYGHNGGQDDIYGASAAPVIGSRRALAMARQNAFQEDGSFRPASDYMFTEEGPNRAGVGSGSLGQGYGAYPNLPSPYYGLDPQGRPYNPDADCSPTPDMYNNIPDHSPYAIPVPSNTRHLVGPHGFPQPDLAPHALGRPAPPFSNFAIGQHEDFADMPEPHTPTNMDYGELPYTPRTAASAGEWAADARLSQDRSRVSMSTPRGIDAGETAALAAATAAARTAPYDEKAFPVAQPTPATLPSFEPMSPLMSEFDLRRNSKQPLAMYEDERSEQKRMYGEVASAANVPEPPTPKSAANLNESTGSTETGSSFSATEPMPRLPPAIAIQPPQPYVHGRPLSPLAEVQTPTSVATRPSVDYPVPSSSLLHEQNPYERTLLAAKAVPGSPAPPYSASSDGASSVPSAAYPPRSPSGMSVPGSVTDSPQQWGSSETRGTRVQSMFDEEDAYGGI